MECHETEADGERVTAQGSSHTLNIKRSAASASMQDQQKYKNPSII